MWLVAERGGLVAERTREPKVKAFVQEARWLEGRRSSFGKSMGADGGSQQFSVASEQQIAG